VRRDWQGDMRGGRQDERQDCCMKRDLGVLKLRKIQKLKLIKKLAR